MFRCRLFLDMIYIQNPKIKKGLRKTQKRKEIGEIEKYRDFNDLKAQVSKFLELKF